MGARRVMSIIDFEINKTLIVRVKEFFLINPTFDEIEDLEINLTDIIKQLQDYRLAQICEDEQ